MCLKCKAGFCLCRPCLVGVMVQVGDEEGEDVVIEPKCTVCSHVQR